MSNILLEALRALNYKENIFNEAVNNLIVVYHSSENPNLIFNADESKEIGLHVGTKQAALDRGHSYLYKLELNLATMNIYKCPVDFTDDMWSSSRLNKLLRSKEIEKELRSVSGSEHKYRESSRIYRNYFLKKGTNTISYVNENEDKSSVSYILLNDSMIVSITRIK